MSEAHNIEMEMEAETALGVEAEMVAPAGWSPPARELANFLFLEHEIRHAHNASALAEKTAHHIGRFIACDCAIIWTVKSPRRLRQVTISGLGDEPDGRAMRQWGRKLAERLARDFARQQKAKLIAPDGMDNALLNRWLETVPIYGFAVPVQNTHGEILGGVALLREAGFTPAQQILLTHLAETMGHSLHALSLGAHRKKARAYQKRWPLPILAALVFIFAGFMIPIMPTPDKNEKMALPFYLWQQVAIILRDEP